jgi:hypothetical protein
MPPADVAAKTAGSGIYNPVVAPTQDRAHHASRGAHSRLCHLELPRYAGPRSLPSRLEPKLGMSLQIAMDLYLDELAARRLNHDDFQGHAVWQRWLDNAQQCGSRLEPSWIHLSNLDPTPAARQPVGTLELVPHVARREWERKCSSVEDHVG